MLATAVAVSAVAQAQTPEKLVVHEWGTFTSVAGSDGQSLEWSPFDAPTDLPPFVHTVASASSLVNGLRQVRPSNGGGKAAIRGTVRMETPVIYFYTDAPVKVSLSVDFPRGSITEWFPRARSVEGTGIDWGEFTVDPGLSEELFLRDDTPSHYYPARETDATPLKLCSPKGDEVEKFLFYRGVGTFPSLIDATVDGDQLALKRARGAGKVGRVIIFERDERGMRYTVTDDWAKRLPRPQTPRTMDALEGELTAMLTKEGLYAREATAMIDTWRDHWFEDGLRIFYITPSRDTEKLLPLTMSPRPTELVRVLVGRIEVIRPETLDAVDAEIKRAERASPAVAKAIYAQLVEAHGRFLEPIVANIAGRRKCLVGLEPIKTYLAAQRGQ